MSTRSRIGIAAEDGTIRSVYCHSDGYFGHVGATLLAHYNTPEAVEQLIELGGLSSLAETIGEKHDFDWMSTDYFSKSRYDYQNDPRNKMTSVYHRDRGEPLRIADHADEETYIADAEESWGEYVYLFKDGQWFATTTYSDSPKAFEPLAAAMEREQAEDEAEEAA